MIHPKDDYKNKKKKKIMEINKRASIKKRISETKQKYEKNTIRNQIKYFRKKNKTRNQKLIMARKLCKRIGTKELIQKNKNIFS